MSNLLTVFVGDAEVGLEQAFELCRRALCVHSNPLGSTMACGTFMSTNAGAV